MVRDERWRRRRQLKHERPPLPPRAAHCTSFHLVSCPFPEANSLHLSSCPPSPFICRFHLWPCSPLSTPSDIFHISFRPLPLHHTSSSFLPSYASPSIALLSTCHPAFFPILSRTFCPFPLRIILPHSILPLLSSLLFSPPPFFITEAPAPESPRVEF